MKERKMDKIYNSKNIELSSGLLCSIWWLETYVPSSSMVKLSKKDSFTLEDGTNR
jgi:hypothetical protein